MLSTLSVLPEAHVPELQPGVLAAKQVQQLVLAISAFAGLECVPEIGWYGPFVQRMPHADKADVVLVQSDARRLLN